MRRCGVKPEPLWMRLAKRPSWERNDPPRLSDYDPYFPVFAAINRTRLSLDRTIARLAALEERELAAREGRRPR
jgi:hypothetical protein